MNVSVSQKNSNKIDITAVKNIAADLGLNEKLVELLFLRGIDDEEALKRFLYPDVNAFYDPFLMKGMAEAVKRIETAIENKEKIVVYGDYDADGVCSAAILSLFLSSRGLDVYAHIPNRVGDGYGLNTERLSQIIDEHIPDLIITCDCGISGTEEVRFALDLGVDVIVTDHHEVSGDIPECIVVNPKQRDCNYPCKNLCGAGVALKVVEALSSREEMLLYLDLACVATIADLVPLTDENRLIVQLGLKRINERKNLGLSMLFDALDLKNVVSGDIAYKIAPRINAAGRMGDAYRAFELLTLTDAGRLLQIVDEIERDNADRKQMCDEMFDEAVGDLVYEDLVHNRAVILSHPSWEKGITGILAARLASEYNRPSFIMVKSCDDVYKGTCRSVEGVNVHELLMACKDYLVEFGGHAQAAGFSIKYDRIGEFKKAVNEYLADFPDELFLPKAQYDMRIDVKDVKYDFVESLDLLEPTGNGNAKPLFRMDVDSVKVAPCKNNKTHVSVTLDTGFQMFAFNYSKLSYQLLSPGVKTLVTELQTGTYGIKTIKGIIRCCSPSELFINDSACDCYEYGLLKYLPKDKCRYTVYNEADVDELVKPLYGTLVIAPDRKAYDEYAAKRSLPKVREYMYATTRNNFSRVIVAPALSDGNLCFSNYDKIIFLRAPLNNGIIAYLNSVTKAEIYIPNEPTNAYELSVERSVFADCFEKIKANAGVPAASVNGLYRHVAASAPELKQSQFAFCLQVFEELGFITIDNNPFRVSVNRGVRADLDSSKIYSLVKERLLK